MACFFGGEGGDGDDSWFMPLYLGGPGKKQPNIAPGHHPVCLRPARTTGRRQNPRRSLPLRGRGRPRSSHNSSVLCVTCECMHLCIYIDIDIARCSHTGHANDLERWFSEEVHVLLAADDCINGLRAFDVGSMARYIVRQGRDRTFQRFRDQVHKQ